MSFHAKFDTWNGDDLDFLQQELGQGYRVLVVVAEVGEGVEGAAWFVDDDTVK